MAFMFERTWARFHEVALSIARGEGTPIADIEFNVFFVVATSAGLLIMPIGIGVGLLFAAAIDLGKRRFKTSEKVDQSQTQIEGNSWVSRRIHKG